MNAKLILKSIVFFGLFAFSCSARSIQNTVKRLEFFYNGVMSTNVMLFLSDSCEPKVSSSKDGDLVNVNIFLKNVDLGSDVEKARFYSMINNLKLLKNANIKKLKNGVLVKLVFDQEKAFVKFASVDGRRFRLEVYSTEELQKIENSVDGPLLMAMNSETPIIPGAKKKNRADFRIVIDPGHGGEDSGARANGVFEKTVALDVSRRAKYILEKAGYTVFLTRNNDSYLSLVERNQIAQKLNADLFVSIHANSAGTNHKAEGLETFHANSGALGLGTKEYSFGRSSSRYNPSTVIKALTLKKVNLSVNLANSIQKSLLKTLDKNKLEAVDRGVKNQSFLVLLRGDFPSVLVEVGFLTNKEEAEMIKDKNYRTLLAYGLSKGVAKFVKNFSTHF